MFKTALKLIFSFALIFWLIQNGKIDFSLLNNFPEQKYFYFMAASLFVLSIILTSFRFKLFLRVQSTASLPMRKFIGLTWIGAFFSSILPGAVTGDIIKLIYARNMDKTLSKTFLVTTALLDRIMGLIGLIFILGFFTLLNYSQLLSKSPELNRLVHFNFFFFAFVFIFFISLLLPQFFQTIILNVSKKIPFLGSKIVNTLESLWEIGKNKKTVFLTLMISIISQLAATFAFYCLTLPFIKEQITLSQFYTFTPIGFTMIAIPISPAGLGVGHAIFDTLFGYYGVKNGASLFNIYFILWVAVNLIGAIPYGLMKKIPPEKEKKLF